jgi:thiamine biosynthesis lipoprotein ApbE
MVSAVDSTVKLASPGMQMDLGAITPGYAVDRAIQVLKNAGIRNALVNAGGEIYSIGFPPKRKAWRIGIRHPRKPGELLGVIELSERGVSTSGDYENFFEVDGRKYCHIIDPKTGRPVQGIMSVTVIAKNTTEADALSTALFPLGAEKGLRLVERLDGVDAIIVTGYKEDDMKILMSSGVKDKMKLKIGEKN